MLKLVNQAQAKASEVTNNNSRKEEEDDHDFVLIEDSLKQINLEKYAKIFMYFLDDKTNN